MTGEIKPLSEVLEQPFFQEPMDEGIAVVAVAISIYPSC